MLFVPFIAFLVAESAHLSGYLVLIVTAFGLSLYGKENLETQRAETLQDILCSGSYIFKTLCYLLMGLSLPLHLESAKQSLMHPVVIGIGVVCVLLTGYVASLFAHKLATPL